MEAAGENYEAREIPALHTEGDWIYPMNIQVKALLFTEMKWRVIEEFGMESFYLNMALRIRNTCSDGC